MVNSRTELLAIIEANAEKLEALGVRRCALFGSFLHGEVSAESDIDLLVEFQPGQKSFSNYSRLVFLLEELLGRRVELVTSEGLSPHIGPTILREAEYVSLGS